MNKLQIISWLLLFYLSTEVLYAQKKNIPFGSKSVTISTVEELYQFARTVNEGERFEGVRIELGNDILLNDTTGWQQWKKGISTLRPWTPIGSPSSPFKGIFDGKGYYLWSLSK